MIQPKSLKISQSGKKRKTYSWITPIQQRKYMRYETKAEHHCPADSVSANEFDSNSLSLLSKTLKTKNLILGWDKKKKKRGARQNNQLLVCSL